MSWPSKLLCLLALAACATLAHAQSQPVYRCIGAQGEPVFSGQPCGTPAPTATGIATAHGSGFGATCAASPQALRGSIADAFTERDVNRLAGLILWRGMDQASARATLHALAAWLKQPLSGIAAAYPNRPPSAVDSPSLPAASSAALPASAASSGPPIGFAISTGGGDGSTRDFGVTESGGCWWLTF